MSGHATILQGRNPAPSDELGRDSNFGLPPNLLAEARRRLGRLALLLTVRNGWQPIVRRRLFGAPLEAPTEVEQSWSPTLTRQLRMRWSARPGSIF